jgi:hypothetical protein
VMTVVMTVVTTAVTTVGDLGHDPLCRLPLGFVLTFTNS